MTKEEFQQLLAEGLKPINTEIAALKANAKSAETAATAQAGADDKIVKLFDEKLKPITDKLTAMENDGKKVVEARAKAAVQEHIQRGAISTEDKDTVEFYEQ